MGVAQALTDFASEIASHEMTAKLERSMDEISEGKISKETVVDYLPRGAPKGLRPPAGAPRPSSRTSCGMA